MQAGASVTFVVNVTPGTNPDSTNLYVQANLTSIGGADSVPFNDDGPNATAARNSRTNHRVADQMPGPRSISLTVGDEQDRVIHPSIPLTVIGPPLTIMQIQGTGSASGHAARPCRRRTTSSPR